MRVATLEMYARIFIPSCTPSCTHMHEIQPNPSTYSSLTTKRPIHRSGSVITTGTTITRSSTRSCQPQVWALGCLVYSRVWPTKCSLEKPRPNRTNWPIRWISRKCSRNQTMICCSEQSRNRPCRLRWCVFFVTTAFADLSRYRALNLGLLALVNTAERMASLSLEWLSRSSCCFDLAGLQPLARRGIGCFNANQYLLLDISRRS